MNEARDSYLAERRLIREELGGKAKVARLRSAGKNNVRERLDMLLDKGSFLELGTFVRSEVDTDRAKTPGDGLIGGLGRIDERPVVAVGYDATVKGGAEGRNGQLKLRKLYQRALRIGHPFVVLGEAAGARIPDHLGSETVIGAEFGRGGGMDWLSDRRRHVPMVTAIVGRSYGESSFIAALSDVVIQVSGTVMALTSPRVIEAATSESVAEEELGGRKVHESRTGQIDLGVDTEVEAFAAIRRLLSYLPSTCFDRPPIATDVPKAVASDERLAELVPADRRRGYDMKRVIRRLVDGGQFFELRPMSGRSTLTMLARMRGRSVGILASQPMQLGGAITPDACDKMVRFICLCDAFNIPIVTLVDTPGFIVGTSAEHDRLLFKGMMLQQALASVRVPLVTIILRKAFGLALFAMSGNNARADAVFAWPGAEIGFMDPDVAVNVLYSAQLADLEPQERATEMAKYGAALKRATTAYGAAVHMGVDEIIDPTETGPILGEVLDRLEGSFTPGESVLRTWPTCW